MDIISDVNESASVHQTGKFSLRDQAVFECKWPGGLEA